MDYKANYYLGSVYVFKAMNKKEFTFTWPNYKEQKKPFLDRETLTVLTVYVFLIVCFLTS